MCIYIYIHTQTIVYIYIYTVAGASFCKNTVWRDAAESRKKEL